MTKSIFSALATVSLISPAVAQQVKENINTPQVLIMTEDDSFKAWIVNSAGRELRYTETENSTDYVDARISSVNVYFLEPSAFAEAMGLYRSRNYKEAHTAFAKCAALYEKFEEIPGNYSSLATFYQMECSRKLEDLATLEAEMEKFIATPLLNNQHKLQLEINKVFWDAVRTKAWERLISIGKEPEWAERKLAGSLRAQVNYCLALAYEGVKEPIRALNAYNGTFVADFAASEVLTSKSALACLRILKGHEDVVLAMKLFGTDEYSENSNGAFLLREGVALVKLWDKSLGCGAELPEEYKVFLKYDQKEG
ncbi:MAG: hypothetical protein ACN4GG_05205 [Akkermansiaceae bacterium]